ncbi:GyrI-like domain-containing protein [Trujillonella humicola]|uniref:GyrI-like domain-containing protein n=1 Tax=Trujillonella humicola TaxID=3383699 RepID=UPI0039058FA1
MRTVHVDVTETTARPAAVVRGHATRDGLPSFLGGAFDAVLRALAGQDRRPAGPPFARYRVVEDGFHLEAGFPADGPVGAADRVVPAELPGGTTATTVHRGSYESLGDTYAALDAWLLEHGFEPAGEAWESYLDDPGAVQPRTLVSRPCRRR